MFPPRLTICLNNVWGKAIVLNNGDTKRAFKVGTIKVRGMGSFHKTLPRNKWREVDATAFDLLVAATEGDGTVFAEKLGC